MKLLNVVLLICLIGFSCKNNNKSGDEILQVLEDRYLKEPNFKNANALVQLQDSLLKGNTLANTEKLKLRTKRCEILAATNQGFKVRECYKDLLRYHPNEEGMQDVANKLKMTYRSSATSSFFTNAIQSQIPNLFPQAASDNSKFDMLSQIAVMQKDMYDDSLKRLDRRKARDYIEATEIFAIFNPTHAQSPILLDKAAETARSILDFNIAIRLYDWIIEHFSNSDKASQAYFLKAFTLDNNLKDIEGARKYYEEFVKKYPNHEFADDTQFLLQNLGKSDEEIIKSFEEKNDG